jgi:hypothetical protein
VNVVTVIALPRVTPPPVLLIVRVPPPVVIFPDSVWAPEPVNVTAALDPVEVPLNDQFPVRETVLNELDVPVVHVPAPLTSPLTVSTLPLDMLRVPVMVIPAQVRLPPVITVAPLAMTTASVAAGTTPPTHVDPVPQLPPVAVEVMVAACAGVVVIRLKLITSIRANKTVRILLFMISYPQYSRKLNYEFLIFTSFNLKYLNGFGSLTSYSLAISAFSISSSRKGVFNLDSFRFCSDFIQVFLREYPPASSILIVLLKDACFKPSEERRSADTCLLAGF